MDWKPSSFRKLGSCFGLEPFFLTTSLAFPLEGGVAQLVGACSDHRPAPVDEAAHGVEQDDGGVDLTLSHPGVPAVTGAIALIARRHRGAGMAEEMTDDKIAELARPYDRHRHTALPCPFRRASNSDDREGPCRVSHSSSPSWPAARPPSNPQQPRRVDTQLPPPDQPPTSSPRRARNNCTYLVTYDTAKEWD
jgi:hypothetical protein